MTPPLESTPVSSQTVTKSLGMVAESPVHPDTQLSRHRPEETSGVGKKKPRTSLSDSSTPPLASPDIKEQTKAPIRHTEETDTLQGATQKVRDRVETSIAEDERQADKFSNSSIMDEDMKLLFSSSVLAEFTAESNVTSKRCTGSAEGEKYPGGVGEPQGSDAKLEKDDNAFLDSLGILEGDKAGDFEEELGLYPEDFSVLFNSSAFLPQEEYGKDTAMNSQGREVGGTLTSTCSAPQPEDSSSLLSQAQYPPVSSFNQISSTILHKHSIHSPFRPPAQVFNHQSSSSDFQPKAPVSSHPGPPLCQQVDYPIDTFYGLPLAVKSCLKENRGISKLYGKLCDM